MCMRYVTMEMARCKFSFKPTGSKLSNNLPAGSRDFSEYLGPVDAEFQFSMITNDIVFKKIMKLKTNKGAGLDNIPIKLINDVAVVISPYLCLIFNQSLSEGKFPNDWKSARVCPIFKSGKRDECANYRPISILSAISKIFEKLVFEQVNQYLTTNKILTDYQSGFRKGFSTCSSLLRTTNKWLVNMDTALINALHFPKPNINALKRSFGYKGAAAWNNIEEHRKVSAKLKTIR